MTKQGRRYLIGCILLFITIVTCLLLVKYGRDLPMIRQTGTLRIVTDNDTANSFEYDIAKLYAEHLGVELKVTQASNYAQCLQIINERGADLLIHFIPNTTEQKEILELTYPIIKTRLMLVQNNQQLINNLTDLENKTIYVEKHSPYILRLLNLKKETGINLHIEETNVSAEELIALVNSGEIACTVCSEFQMHTTNLDTENINYKTMIGIRHFMSWGLSNSTPYLLNDLNEWLQDFVESIEYRNLIRQYYH